MDSPPPLSPLLDYEPTDFPPPLSPLILQSNDSPPSSPPPLSPLLDDDGVPLELPPLLSLQQDVDEEEEDQDQQPELSACERFFSIPELVEALAAKLTTKQLVTLIKTNRRMQVLCEPALFRDLDLVSKEGYKRFESIPAVQAIGRNGRHVRSAKLEIVSSLFYYNGLIGNNTYASTDKDDKKASEDSASLPTYNKTALMDNVSSIASAIMERDKDKDKDPTAVTMPLPLPDCPIPAPFDFIPFAPMSNLTKIHMSIYGHVENTQSKRYFMNSSFNSENGLRQACYILEQSPHLVDVTLDEIYPEMTRELQFLPRTIQGLSKLRRLELGLTLARFQWPHFGTTIFYACPPSIQELKINFADMEMDSMAPNPLVGYIDTNGTGARPWTMDDYVWKATTPRRQEPLYELTKFSVGALKSETTAEVLAQLDHCPEVVQLSVPFIGKRVKVNDVVQHLVKNCRELASLVCDGFQSKQINTLTNGIIQAMPEQTLQEINWPGYKDDPAIDYRKFYSRHSRTLRKLDVVLCRGIQSKTIQAVMCECYAMEEFLLQPHHWTSDIKLDLADAVAAPWVCTRMRTLYLLVGIEDLRPTSVGQAGVLKPYYKRKPFFLKIEEKEQFSQLEAFYKQIGKLTKLSTLVLKAKMLRASDPPNVLNTNTIEDEAGIWFGYQKISFPAMLSLGDAATGRPGYLQHLKGLKNLRLFLGSVAVDTDETITTVGWDEIRFIDKYWPKLQRTEMIQNHKGKDNNGELWHKPVAWLMKQRPGLKVTMPNGLPMGF
ncbi:hypothetical protein BGW39_002292 [Mortierella sp. 14UC]|nr:hypothetical protein BGW39_002292 [Mortierella sp. 14UC]